MAAYFFDTSGIVKRYIKETGTPWVQAVADPGAGNVIFLAGISGVEVTSAIARRLRAGNLSAAEAASFLVQFRQDRVLEYRIIEITPTILTAAERLAESRALRANDAVQLAAAVELHARRTVSGLDPFALVSADQDLNTAATALSLVVEDPNLHP
jgi:uncharacterized protein